MLKKINTKQGEGSVNTLYRDDYYKVLEKKYEGGYRIIFINKIASDRYLPSIEVMEDLDTEEIVGFKIQTVAYGAKKTEEIEKIIAGYNAAIDTVKQMEELFL